MRIASTISDVVNAYDDVAFEIYVSGCYRACPGCHSPELQSFDVGTQVTLGVIEELINQMQEEEEYFGIISLLGGDLLCQPESSSRQFVAILKYWFPDKAFWLFTGAEADELPAWAKQEFDAIKYGRFDQELYVPGRFPASTNQKVLRKGKDY